MVCRALSYPVPAVGCGLLLNRIINHPRIDLDDELSNWPDRNDRRKVVLCLIEKDRKRCVLP